MDHDAEHTIASAAGTTGQGESPSSSSPQRTGTTSEKVGPDDDSRSPRGIRSTNPLPLPPVARLDEEAAQGQGIHRTRTTDTFRSRRSNIDWIVPVEGGRRDSFHRAKKNGERLQPTLDIAQQERANYAWKAKYTGIALNVAIGLQVLLGALTTALAAATSGPHAGVAISVLGAASTMVASYLARARGSNEPELSIIRVKDLDQFIRECQAFMLDYGHLEDDHQHDETLDSLRQKFEELLGNGNGERRLATV